MDMTLKVIGIKKVETTNGTVYTATLRASAGSPPTSVFSQVSQPDPFTDLNVGDTVVSSFAFPS